MKPIRRVVTGNDAHGRSKVTWDGPAPNTDQGYGWADLWVWNETPAPLNGERDDGNLPYEFPGPPAGGHLRVIQSRGRPPGYDSANDPGAEPTHEPTSRAGGRRLSRGGRNIYSSDMHKTETVDYALLIEGDRDLVLDDGVISWRPGDMVIQVGAYHQWTSPRGPATVAFDMIGARFVDGPAGLPQGNDLVMTVDPKRKLPEGVKAARRIVTIDREPGRSSLVSDGPTPDLRMDPARPGFAAQRMWVIDSMPAKIVFETLHLPHTIEPPPAGSVLRVVTYPPDECWKGKVGSAEVQAYFRAMGSPGASTYSPLAPHPYMQKTRSLDFCVILEGEILLVLDTQEVSLQAGEIAILRGGNHAWSNRSNNPAVLAIAAHDGAW